LSTTKEARQAALDTLCKLRHKATKLAEQLNTAKGALSEAGLSFEECLKQQPFPLSCPRKVLAPSTNPRSRQAGPIDTRKPAAARSRDDVEYDEELRGAKASKASATEKRLSTTEVARSAAEARAKAAAAAQQDKPYKPKPNPLINVPLVPFRAITLYKQELKKDFSETLAEIAKWGEIIEYQMQHEEEVEKTLEKLAKSVKALKNDPHNLDDATLSELAGTERMNQLEEENYTWDEIVKRFGSE